MNTIYEKLAALHGVKPEEVEREMREAIKQGRNSEKAEAFWSGLGDDPAPEDVIKSILDKIE